MQAIWLVAVLVIAIVLYVRMVSFRTITIFEYQRGLKYVRGRYRETLGPGQYWTSRRVNIVPVDVRPVFVTVPGQEVMTTDGVAVKATIAAQYEVVDPNLAINKDVSYQGTTYLLLQMSLRKIIGSETLEALLQNRDTAAAKLREMVAPDLEARGLRLISADLKDIMLPGEIKKSFGQVLKAQKDGLAALERARGESAALRNMANAAKMIEENPNLLQLRALQVLGETSGNTMLFGVPQGGVVQVAKNGGGEKK